MNWFTGLVVFLITWWLVLFAVLPFGVKPNPDPEPGSGHMAGAPQKPMLVRKALITTAITAVVWLIIFMVIEADLISFRNPPT
jgi:predicted secreted protein